MRERRARDADVPPRLGSRGRRFGLDLLWQTGRHHSTRSIGRGTRQAPPAPMRFRSHRVSRPLDRPLSGRRSRIEPWTTRPHSVLCPILRQPRVSAPCPRTWSRASLDQCPLYRIVSREMFLGNMEIVGVIPARFASTRLPGKPLLSDTGRPLIQHVVEAARRAKSLGRIIVATDDPRIADAVTSFGGEVMMTRADHPTGTDRVAEVAARLDGTRIIVNLQGDEPEVSGDGAGPGRRAAGGRPRGADGHPGDADPRRGDLPRPVVRQGRLLAPRSRPLLLAEPDPLPPRRAPRPRPRRATARLPPPGPLRLPPRVPARARRRSPPPRWSPPRSSSSSASSRPATRSPSASSNEPSIGIDTPEDYRRFVERWRAAEDGNIESGDADDREAATGLPLNSGGTRCQMRWRVRGLTVKGERRTASSSTKRVQMPQDVENQTESESQRAAPGNHTADRRDLRRMWRDPSPRPLPSAQLPRGRQHPGGPEGDPLSRLRPPAEPAPGERRLPRRRPDRQPARPPDAADRPGVPPRLQGPRSRDGLRGAAQEIVAPASSRRSPNCGTSSPRTCRPPTTATRPPRASTRSSSATPAWRRSRSIGWPTSSIDWACR